MPHAPPPLRHQSTRIKVKRSWWDKLLNKDAAVVAKETAIIGGSATAASIAVPTAATGALSLAGFGSGGIVGGSIAAGVQASIGNVAAGSIFAGLQSVGATGGFAILGPLGIVAGVVTALGVGGFVVYKTVDNYLTMINQRNPVPVGIHV